MKIKKSTRLVKMGKRVFNVRAWMDYDRIKSSGQYLVNGFKNLFIPQKHGKEESFDAATKRLGIDEKSLQAKQSSLYRLSLLMVTVSIFLFGYAVYHLCYGNYRATIVSIIVMLIGLALAFRYHFWYFQIKERKLGCSISEWYRQGIKGGK